MDLRPGQVLSHFRIVERIDEGGMGIVYRARDLHLERDVALKVLSTRRAVDESAVHRFKREALALSRLNHPNIAAVFDFDVCDSIQFLVMEWIPGVTLSRKAALGRLSEAEIVDYGEQIASGLGYAHGEGVIHRDLKPQNVRIAPDGRLKIVDFGLAKLRPISDSDITDTLPAPTKLVGTLPYIAPEVLDGQPASPASDIYGLGAILYEAATSRRPFPMDDAHSLTLAIRSEAPTTPRALNPALSPELEQIILRCLEKKPDRRYESALEVRADLRRISSGLPLVIPRRQWRMSRNLMWIAIALIITVGLAVLGLVSPRARPGAVIMKPLVTWPSHEWSAQISPDKEWIAFVSDHGGRTSVWLQRVKGGEPSLVFAEEGIADVLWSPDGESLGALVNTADGVSFMAVPAFGARARSNTALPVELKNARLIRWYGTHLYLAFRGRGLWRFDTQSGKANLVVAARGDEGIRERFDIDQREEHVVYTVRTDRQLTIWRVDLADGKPERLTQGNSNDTGARFGGPGGEYVFFASDRSGQVDLWRLTLADGTLESVTVGPGIEWMQSVSPDLSLLTFIDERDSGHLWLYDAPTHEHRQLTAEGTRDDWPSLSNNGALVVQRQKPEIKAGIFALLNGEILLSSLDAERRLSPWTHIADGGKPQLSPDGRYLAYARAGQGSVVELRVKTVSTATDWQVTDHHVPSRFYVFPRDWKRATAAWMADGTLLYVASEDGQDRIRSWSEHEPAGTRFTAPKGTAIRELYSDGGDIVFVTEPDPPPGIAQLHVLDQLGGDRVMYSMKRTWQDSLYVRGRIRTGSLIVMTAAVNADFTERVSVIGVKKDGAAGVIGGFDGAFAGTARLDPMKEGLYFTGVDRESIHNMYFFSFADGQPRRITNNGIPGVSFAAFLLDGRGNLLYVRQESTHDIWMIRKERE